MIPFEERHAAWVDGTLNGKELAAFEKELSARDEKADKEDILKMGALLRRHPTAPQLTNPDFFDYQIQHRIAAETVRATKAAETPGFFWPFRRLILAGGFSLVMAFGLYEALIPASSESVVLEPIATLADDPNGTQIPEAPGKKDNYFAKVIETWPSEPTISASTVYNSDQPMTVLWLDGLEPVSSAYAQAQ